MEAALVVLDGWGINDDPGEARDAVAAADTPAVDGYFAAGADARLDAAGTSVGLPDGQMGNSEVGHLTIGGGRIVEQAPTRIDDAIAAGTLGDCEAIDAAFAHAERTGGRVHLLGLVSDGGVHACQRHVHALIELAADRGVPAVTHAFTDGRDTGPTDGEGYLAQLADVVAAAGTGDVATVCGRYYAMDRDGNWERTLAAYEAIVDRSAPHVAPDPVAAVRRSYERGDTDEFVEPTLIEGGPALSDGDAAIFVNFRADRARQLTRMLGGHRPVADDDTDPPTIELVTMTRYDEEFDLPVAVPPNRPADTLGAVLASHGATQLRIAESEKYAHVTYFLNGGRERRFEGEHREIVDSPDVATYDLQPEMAAPAVTDVAIERIERADPDVLVLNYANPDMVGHTGDFAAAVAAVEAVDRAVGRLVPVLLEHGAGVILTADHGNAEDMGTREDPHTAHTTNPVPVALLAPDGTAGGRSLRAGGLRDLAPTVLARCGIDVPDAMTGSDLAR